MAGTNKLLIRGGQVYDHDGDIHQPAQADILIGGERIERIGPNLPAEAGVEVIDAAGKLVVPGFVNAHYHSHDVMAKGLFEEMPFDIWTIHTNAVNYGPRSHKEVRIRTLIGASEMLRNGITSVQDFLTVVPGIRPSGSPAADQKRVVTPREALEAGADLLVVGRAVTAAPDPDAALEGLLAEIESAR